MTPDALRRTDALRIIDSIFPSDPIVLTLGGTVREMIAACGRRPNHLYVLDSMGLPVPIGLGLAVGLADDPRHERIVVVEGDGSLLMGFSVLPTIGLMQPRKLVVVVLDNGVYLATGGQPTAASAIDFAAAAQACSFKGVDAEGPDALRAALATARTTDGPHLIHARVGTAAPPTDFFLEDPAVIGADFTRWLAAPR
jgi:thiamine pyrophosphate-dependent acetolactate synthase large subunit-like protein